MKMNCKSCNKKIKAVKTEYGIDLLCPSCRRGKNNEFDLTGQDEEND